MTRRIFAPPWVVDDTSTESFCIRDAKGHALRYVNYEDETGGLTMAGDRPTNRRSRRDQRSHNRPSPNYCYAGGEIP
jgi:hypothetical protein